MSDETKAAKQIAALQKRLAGEQLRWAIPASAVLGVGTPGMRQEHDGIVAGTAGQVHYFRKSLVGGTHESLDRNDIESVDTTILRFGNGDVEAVLINLHAGDAWALVADADRLDLLMAKLSDEG